MDQNQNPYNNPYNMPAYRKTNYMETAALVLGVLSITMCSCLYAAYICGAIAIVLALFSRGGKMKMSSKAKTGLILAIIGIVLTTIFYAASFYIAITEFGSIEGILKEYCDKMGLDFVALYGDLFQ